MSRHRVLGVWSLVATIGLLLTGRALSADPGSSEGALQSRLAAGEFAPALEIARRAANREQHDTWLAQIAATQAQAGARDASFRSAAEIYDDRARASAIAHTAAEPWGAAGGGAEADFDSLIDLITTTVKPQSWDTVGGPGSVAPFPTGVYVDSQGVLRTALKQAANGDLAALRNSSAPRAAQENVRQSSPLRMVSLPRLERQVQLLLAMGRPPEEAMQVLAGLQRIKYVFVYPQSADIVLAGPAGDWTTDREGRVVATATGQPVLRLDDLVVVLRQMLAAPDARFGCLITPTQDALARVQALLAQSGKRLIRPEQFRAQLGQQDIEVYGLDPRTRAARVMVEADYRMKLVGMGIEPGVPGVESYLASIKLAPGQSPPPMGVLRWWFTLNYEAVMAAQDRQAFALRGQGVKVLSENEQLTAEGKRVHTGQSDELNRQFAQSFTAHFEALAAKYPVYAELRNIFDLALVGGLMREEDLPGKTGWHLTCFGSSGAYPVELGPAPKKVDTVMNSRVIHGRYIVTGVSGGVRVHPTSLVAQAIVLEHDGALGKGRSAAAPKRPPLEAWWWD